MTQTATKVFDAATANQRLPLIRSITKSVVEDWAKLQKVREALKALEATAPQARSSTLRKTISDLKEETTDLSNALDRYMVEADVLGVSLCDLKRGGMHFPAVAPDSADMVLCWRPGEPAVGHWHLASDACTARCPIPPH